MEEVTHQIRHREAHHREVASIYLVLLFILIMPLMWSEYGSNRVNNWHPFYDVEYSLNWYIAICMYKLKPLLYLVVARLAKERHSRLIMVFIGYEFVLCMDYILVYSQSPGIVSGAWIISCYIMYYHYRYG